METPQDSSLHLIVLPAPQLRWTQGIVLCVCVLVAMAVVPVANESPVVSPRSVSSDKSSKVYGYSLAGLHTSWDNTPVIRERLRNGKNLVLQFDPEREELVNGPVDKTLANVRNNLDALKPVLLLMRENNVQPPVIDYVIEEVRHLYNCSKVKVNHDTIYHQSWAIRHLASLAKNTIQHRKFLSEDKYCMHICQSQSHCFSFNVHSTLVDYISVQFISRSSNVLRYIVMQGDAQILTLYNHTFRLD